MLLLDFLRPRRIRQTALAAHIAESPSELNRLITGKRDLSARLAWKLAQALGTTPRFWMDLQSDVDLWTASSC